MVRVALTGDDLAGFEDMAPTQHLKLLFPAPGEDAPSLPEFGPDGLRFPDGQPRPVMRTFTPRRFDPGTATLQVDFVLHDEGPASAWARQARVGQRLAVAGPGGRMPLTLGPGRWIVAGDESAIPAIGTLLEALPADAVAEVLLEVESGSDEIELGSAASRLGDLAAAVAAVLRPGSARRRREPPTSPASRASGWPARPGRCAVSGGPC